MRLSILSPKSLWKSKLNTLPGRMLLIWPKNSKSKYQNDSLSSVTSRKKLSQWYFNDFTKENHQNPIEKSLKYHRDNFFWTSMEVWESFWYFHFDFFAQIKSIRPGNIASFDFQRDFGPNIDSRKIKKGFALSDTESRKLARNRSNFVKSHYNTGIIMIFVK